MEYSSNTDLAFDKERKIIYNVLSQYDFEVTNCIKVKSVYKIETSKGNLCLKRMRHGKSKPNNCFIIAKALMDNGFYNIAKYYKTNDGKSYVRRKKLLFYVTDWIDGGEGDLNNFDEVILIVKSLAQFHLATNNIDIDKLKLKSNLKNWHKVFTESLRGLEKYERIINNKRIKSEFDLSYYDYIQSMYHRGMIALNLLNTADYYKLSKHANKNRTLCQNNFYSENIVKKDDRYYIMDLGNIVIDLQLIDLGKLISKIIYKKIVEWDFNKVKLLIEAYTSINKLNRNELETMLALLVFPYKFWKLGKKRYVKHKAWDESKYMHKLTKLTKYDELQNKFLEDFLCYMKKFD